MAAVPQKGGTAQSHDTARQDCPTFPAKGRPHLSQVNNHSNKIASSTAQIKFRRTKSPKHLPCWVGSSLSGWSCTRQVLPNLPRQGEGAQSAELLQRGSPGAAPSLPSRPPPLGACPPPSRGTGSSGRLGRCAGRGEDSWVVLGTADPGAQRPPDTLCWGQWRRQGRQGDHPPRPPGPGSSQSGSSSLPLPRPGSSRPPPCRVLNPDWSLPPSRAGIGGGSARAASARAGRSPPGTHRPLEAREPPQPRTCRCHP